LGKQIELPTLFLICSFYAFSSDTKNMKVKSLIATLMVDAKFDGVDLIKVVMSKAYVMNASFKGRHIIV
jgi:hypothetical protein